jgi:hypothetical protein
VTSRVQPLTVFITSSQRQINNRMEKILERLEELTRSLDSMEHRLK